jgi:hypothetical protein
MVHQIILWGYASIHKHVPLPRMPVDVTKHNDLILTELLEQVLRVEDGRVQEF